MSNRIYNNYETSQAELIDSLINQVQADDTKSYLVEKLNPMLERIRNGGSIIRLSRKEYQILSEAGLTELQIRNAFPGSFSLKGLRYYAKYVLHSFRNLLAEIGKTLTKGIELFARTVGLLLYSLVKTIRIVCREFYTFVASITRGFLDLLRIPFRYILYPIFHYLNQRVERAFKLAQEKDSFAFILGVIAFLLILGSGWLCSPVFLPKLQELQSNFNSNFDLEKTLASIPLGNNFGSFFIQFFVLAFLIFIYFLLSAYLFERTPQKAQEPLTWGMFIIGIVIFMGIGYRLFPPSQSSFILPLLNIEVTYFGAFLSRVAILTTLTFFIIVLGGYLYDSRSTMKSLKEILIICLLIIWFFSSYIILRSLPIVSFLYIGFS